MKTTRRGFIGLLTAFVAFVRFAIPRAPLAPQYVQVPQPIVDSKASGSFWMVEEEPGRPPVTTYFDMHSENWHRAAGWGSF